jgi:hypothetical protein
MPRMKTKIVNGELYEMTKFSYRCDICNDVIESKSKYTPIGCKCDNLFITGGIEYGGSIAAKFDKFTDMSEWKLIKGDFNVNIMPSK